MCFLAIWTSFENCPSISLSIYKLDCFSLCV
jgi:hypothetical protein